MDEAKERDGGQQRESTLPDPVAQGVLVFDIETAPLLAHIWQARTEYVPHHALVHDSFLLSWAAKWYGSPENNVFSAVLTTDEAKNQDDSRIVSLLADMVRNADVTIAHNIDRFDIPMLNNRVLALDLDPLGPVRTIDTLKLAKKNFRLAYNKLDYLGEFLGVGKKIPTDFDLWLRCYHGDREALNEMVTYNRQDVVLLERVFDKIKPHVRNLPRLFDAGWDGQLGCPHCGSTKLVIRGYYRTQASTFPKFQCKGCRRYHRARSSTAQPKFKVHPL